MNKKGIAVIGPTLVLVKLLSLIFATTKVTLILGVIFGVAFNKKIKELGKKYLITKAIIFLILTFLLITLTNTIIGPTADHHIPMLLAAIVFAIVQAVIMIREFEQDKKFAAKLLSIMTIAFIIISQLAILWVTKW